MSLAEEVAKLEKRVSALERHSVNNTETIRWLASTLGGMKAVQDDHTQQFDRLENEMGEVKDGLTGLGGVKAEITGLRRDLPSIVADVMREVLNEGR